MESEIAQQNFDSNENMDHLKSLEKELISIRKGYQDEIDRLTSLKEDLLARASSGRKRRHNSKRCASVERNLKELRLQHKKASTNISNLNKNMVCISQPPENPGQHHHIEKLLADIDVAIANNCSVDNMILVQFRALIKGMRNELIKVEKELAGQKHLLETQKYENLAAREQITSLKEELNAEKLLSVSLKENKESHNDMILDMQKFENEILKNQDLAEKLRCCEVKIESLTTKSMDMDSQLMISQNTIRSLQEKLEACKSENEELANKLSKDTGVYQSKIQWLHRELDKVQHHSGSGDSESQQDSENDSAFHSGTSSPTLSISSQAESLVDKNNLAEGVQAKFQQLQLNFEELGFKYDELQNKLSVSRNELTHSLQEKEKLLDKLGNKECEVRSLTEKLVKETDKSSKLDKELYKVSKKLINSQKLLRQFQTKKANWANYYVDLEQDYYNGLNYHLDHIQWLEGECQKLESSNKYLKNKSFNSEAANVAKDLQKKLDTMHRKMKRQEHGANNLAEDLKKQLNIIEKDMKALKTENSELVVKNNKLSKALATEKQTSSALGRDLKMCEEDLHKSIAENHKNRNQAEMIENLKEKIKDLEEEYSPHADSVYAHSEEEYDSQEESQGDLRGRWDYASEDHALVNEDHQYVQKQKIMPPTTAYSLGGISYVPAQSGPTQQKGKTPRIAVIPGENQCTMVCLECGESFRKTTDVPGHKCENKTAPILQKLRSCRPKEPPPQRSYNRGGTYLGPPLCTLSWEQRINVWEMCQENGGQEDYDNLLELDEFSEED